MKGSHTTFDFIPVMRKQISMADWGMRVMSTQTCNISLDYRIKLNVWAQLFVHGCGSTPLEHLVLLCTREENRSCFYL